MSIYLSEADCVWESPRCHRIVLTGGPGGGKTTACDLLRRELREKVAYVPEAATMLYSGGFPRYPEAGIFIQRAIYTVQKNLEDANAMHFPGKILLCDRGTVDGAAYWPGGDVEEFFTAMGTNLNDELNRYDGVIFFESAAMGNLAIDSGNRCRNESVEEAQNLDRRLREVWQKHPVFVVVPHQESFFAKIACGLKAFKDMVLQLRRKSGISPVHQMLITQGHHDSHSSSHFGTPFSLSPDIRPVDLPPIESSYADFSSLSIEVPPEKKNEKND